MHNYFEELFSRTAFGRFSWLLAESLEGVLFKKPNLSRNLTNVYVCIFLEISFQTKAITNHYEPPFSSFQSRNWMKLFYAAYTKTRVKIFSSEHPDPSFEYPTRAKFPSLEMLPFWESRDSFLLDSCHNRCMTIWPQYKLSGILCTEPIRHNMAAITWHCH